MVFTPAALQPGKKEETGVGYTELEKALWVLCSILLLLLTFFFFFYLFNILVKINFPVLVASLLMSLLSYSSLLVTLMFLFI